MWGAAPRLLPQNSCTFRASPFPSASTEGALLSAPRVVITSPSRPQAHRCWQSRGLGPKLAGGPKAVTAADQPPGLQRPEGRRARGPPRRPTRQDQWGVLRVNRVLVQGARGGTGLSSPRTGVPPGASPRPLSWRTPGPADRRLHRRGTCGHCCMWRALSLPGRPQTCPEGEPAPHQLPVWPHQASSTRFP